METVNLICGYLCAGIYILLMAFLTIVVFHQLFNDIKEDSKR